MFLIARGKDNQLSYMVCGKYIVLWKAASIFAKSPTRPKCWHWPFLGLTLAFFTIADSLIFNPDKPHLYLIYKWHNDLSSKVIYLFLHKKLV
jgi:hypothetical protein